MAINAMAPESMMHEIARDTSGAILSPVDGRDVPVF